MDGANCHTEEKEMSVQCCKALDTYGVDLLKKEKKMDVYSGRVTRSRSCAHDPSFVRDCLHIEKNKMDLSSGGVTRSKSCAQGSGFVRDSLASSCSDVDCKDDTFGHVAKVQRSGPIGIFYREHEDTNISVLPISDQPSAVFCQNSGNFNVNNAECQSKNKGTDIHAGGNRGSKILSECQLSVCESKNGCSFEESPIIDVAPLISEDVDLPHDYVDGSQVKISSFNVHDEGCEEQKPMSRDCKNQRERFAIQSSCSSQQDSKKKASDLQILHHSANADSANHAPLNRWSSQLVNRSNEMTGLIRPSIGLFCRVRRSLSLSNDYERSDHVDCNENHGLRSTISKSHCKQSSTNDELKNSKNDKLKNFLTDQFSSPFGAIHDKLDDNEIGHFVAPERVDQHTSSSGGDVKLRRQLKLDVVPTPSMEPRSANIYGNEHHNLKAFTSCSGKRRLSNTEENLSCSLSDPPMQVYRGNSLGKQVEVISNYPIEGVENRWNSSETADLQNSDVCAENYGHVTNEHTMVKASADYTVQGKIYKDCEACQDADIVLEKIMNNPNMGVLPLKFNVEHGVESLPDQHREEGKCKSLLMETPPESEKLGSSQFQNFVEELRLDSFGSISQELQAKNYISAELSQNFSCPLVVLSGKQVDSPVRDNGYNTSLERKCRHFSIESWPQLKRRKIECQRTYSFSPINRTRVSHNIFSGPGSKHLYNMKVNADTNYTGISDGNVITDAEIHKKMLSNLTEGTESVFSSQKPEKNVEEDTSSVSNTQQLEAAIVASLPKQGAQHSQDCFTITRIPSPSGNDAREPSIGQCSSLEKNLNDHPSFENLTHANAVLDDMKYSVGKSCLQLSCSALLPSIDGLKFVEVDQSKPVLEGFTVDDLSENEELDTETSGINFNKIELPRNTIERASILAEICKSVSLDTPLSCYLPTLEFQGTRNLYQSISNGHHEHLEMQSSLPVYSNVEKQLHSVSILGGEYDDSLAMPYSDSVTYSGAQCDWNSTNQLISPVAKPWRRLSLHTGGTEKSSSSNPELVCFTIEEDPCTSEENRSADEHADEVQEDIVPSPANHHGRKQPFKDLSNQDVNPCVSAQAESLKRLDSMKTKLSVTGADDEFQLITHKHEDTRQTIEMERSYVGSTDGRKSHTLSVGTNKIQKAKVSINHSISKPHFPKKASLKRQDPKLSLKESSNIISNMSSFIPLVQQKKVATVCTGKKDVKVKALEVAEAARRLEEKKEHDRKMRKEVLKLERVKLEEKNLKEIEIQKKKKEEQKKKYAENIANKRLREEEAKKEKEKKRMRVDTRQCQREQEEKVRAEKLPKKKKPSEDKLLPKEKQPSEDQQVHSKKESQNESKKQLNMAPSTGDDKTSKTTENKGIPSDVLIHQECGTSGQSFEADKATHTLDKSPKMEGAIIHNNRGTSYEISPYQCSDDEDELSAKKHIPSWASKHSVGLLLSQQQDMDPDVIFPSERFCCIEEVVLPRKLRLKEMAA